MQHMRNMQDEQFKMLQMVIESQHKRNAQSSLSSIQGQGQFMYYPWMGQPQFHSQMYPQYYQHQQWDPRYTQQYYQDNLEESQTES